MNAKSIPRRPSRPSSMIVGQRKITLFTFLDPSKTLSPSSLERPYISTGAGVSSSPTGSSKFLAHRQLDDVKTMCPTPNFSANLRTFAVPSTFDLHSLGKSFFTWASSAAKWKIPSNLFAANTFSMRASSFMSPRKDVKPSRKRESGSRSIDTTVSPRSRRIAFIIDPKKPAPPVTR